MWRIGRNSSLPIHRTSDDGLLSERERSFCCGVISRRPDGALPHVAALLRQIILSERMQGKKKPYDLKVPATARMATQALWRQPGVQATAVGRRRHVICRWKPPRNRFSRALGATFTMMRTAKFKRAMLDAADHFIEQAIAYSHYTSVGRREARSLH